MASCAVSSSSQPPAASVSQLIAVLAPVALYALVYFGIFLFVRPRLKRNYQPRTFLGSLRPHERSPQVSDSLFGWIGEFYRIPDTYVLNHHSLDGYLFLRFLRLSVIACVVGCVITWPILFPINATGGGTQQQLNVLTIGNVTNNYFKYFAHCLCAIIFYCYLLYMITRECIYYINLRQAYLLSPFYASRLSSRTVLFTSVPEEYMEEGKLRRMLGQQVRRVWLVTNTKDLEKKVKLRDKAAMKLEGAEIKLISNANKNRLKEEKKGNRVDADEAGHQGSGSIAARYVPAKKRPTHRLTMLIGKKVDTIDWCRAELQKLIPEVDHMQAEHKSAQAKKVNSVFVEFETLSEAQAAYQSLTHHHALHMAPRFTGMTPGEVIWSNLRIKWWELLVRKLVTTAFVCALVIFWAIPVAFVGFISNLQNLIAIPGFSWLSFINKLPPQLLGVVTGLLPVILLAVLMALLPIILRAVAKLGGDPTRSAVELTVQNSYFAFQVVQVFLVVTLSSSASAVGGEIAANPVCATSLLAAYLPNANTFYLSYFILQGLAVVSGVLLSLVGLLIFKVLGKLLDGTPRKMYKRWISLSGLGWGTLLPVYTNLFVIAICYIAIAPLVMGFAAIGLYLFYFAYRYNLLFVSNANIDTQGRIFPRALKQLFVGIYLSEGCLIGLFAIASGTSVGAVGPLILMILFLIFTILYQVALGSALAPLIKYLPKSLDAEERHLLSLENGGAQSGGMSGGQHHQNGMTDHNMEKGMSGNGAAAADVDGGTPHKKPSFIMKFLRPDKYTDYKTMRRLVPKDIAVEYTREEENEAFFNPAITSRTPLLWIPRDEVGMSREAVRDDAPIIPITDEGAFLDDKNKVVWDAPDGRPPIYEQTPYY